ncbi:hypothetical protein [Agrococcus sp. ARC_14]|uniref:hypothetical protein n=1 Tax=Agrococcus sp. ARC_14 TaxID=2919927 RepID=UPI001F06B4B1|nr:hypothetical protein [Agrococcus sp. ARC_14]MCH1882999.1 hypothetical protein [Agrococcus sp. ARC_14]
MVALVTDDGAEIAGYPLVRALRRDGEREVWVAADASGVGVEVHRSLPGSEAALARECEALLAVDHPHLVPILDVATDGGAVLVRPLLPRSLADWLVQRRAPEPGEAVTALAPIAAALGALHAGGASAGGCAAHDVRVDADGAPLLVGAGAQIETARPTAAWREGSAGVAADTAGWRQLAVALLEAGGSALPVGVERALEQRDLAAAGDALLAAWPGLPLELDAPAAALPSTERVRMRRRERAVGVEAVWARLALLTERLVALGGPSVQRFVAAAAAVRPRFWAIAGGGAAALVVTAVLLWPAGAADAGGPAGGGTDGAPTPTASPSATDEPAASPVPTASEPSSEAPASTESDASEGTEADEDPVAAAAALLAEREACLDADDAACLVALHEPDSPLLRAEDPWRMPDDGTLEVVQRIGDAWLLRVASERPPASVLMMSTEAGWTLRDAWSG